MSEKDKTAFMQQSPLVPRPVTPSGKAVLVVIHPQGPQMGKRFPLEKQEHVIGRLDELDVPLEGDGLSRKHARLLREPDGWFLEDLGSTNGSFVNDARVTRKQIGDGDLLRFGVSICKFLSGDNIEAAYHEEIYRMSVMDAMTNVHNKRYFREFLDREIAVASRQSTPLSLMMIDIDYFKKINDTHGHLAGDSALKELCNRLRPRIRKTDLFARYGGEEFSVIMPGATLRGAMIFAEELRQIIEKDPFTFEAIVIPCTVSLGVAEFDPANARAEELIERADAKLYEAKRGGRNRVVG